MTVAEARAIFGEIESMCLAMPYGFAYRCFVVDDLPVRWLVVPGTLDMVLSPEGEALKDEATLILAAARKL
jgi:hypothetical protein